MAVAHRSRGELRTLLLVRNAVSHDARVLRAARVAEKALGGRALVVGVATTLAPAGEARVEGVRVLRLDAAGAASAEAQLTGILQRCVEAGASVSYRGLPMPVALTLVVAGLLAVMLKNLVWGRHVYATGGNRAAARVAGIAVSRQIILGYVLIGVLTAVRSAARCGIVEMDKILAIPFTPS